MKLTESIKRLLDLKTHENLSAMYHEGMECQINVKTFGRDPEPDGNYFEDDDGNKWYNIRIPKKADTEPEFDLDRKTPFDLAHFAEGIGLTGWNWKDKRSIFCIYDFDTIVGHSANHTAKISEDEMERVRVAASNIPWVTTRRSTGGKGLHLHVDIPIPESEMDSNFLQTNNHSEHAALARAILGQMSALAEYDFSSSVDICGGNTWFWHTKIEKSDGMGLTTIKEADHPIPMDVIPKNWRDHIRVTTGKGKLIPESVIKAGLQEQYEQMVGGRKFIELDYKHKELFKFLSDNGLYWHWEGEDVRRLVTHTTHLKKAYSKLNFSDGSRVRGYFNTASSGSTEYNCYCFPLKDGGWIVRRYSKGVNEHESWSQDGAGWTKTYFNKDVTFDVACRAAKGTVHPEKGYFVFKDGLACAEALRILSLTPQIPQSLTNAPVMLRRNKFSQVSIVYQDATELTANQLGTGWFFDSKKKELSYTYGEETTNEVDDLEDTADVDALVRHIIHKGEEVGWVLRNAHGWTYETIHNVRLVLGGAMGIKAKQVSGMLGTSVLDAWNLTNKPFEPEYPGGRMWNKDAAQLAFQPFTDQEVTPADFPHWQSLLDHVGGNLDSVVAVDKWCIDSGIKTGADYLMYWCACLFQYPMEPLPYLFLYGKQNTGKSMFHEALSMLFTKGYVRADSALSPKSEFNGELDGSVLCVVEETDVGGNKTSANRMKDWVTSPKMSIHPKGGTPFIVDNTSHWIQCANDHSYCPQLDNDTRITMIYVPELDRSQYIPKGILEIALRREAKHFTTYLMNIKIPKSNDRLRIPILNTQEKEMVEAANRCPLAAFMAEALERADGEAITLSEVHRVFTEQLDPEEVSSWTLSRFRNQLPANILRGRYTNNKMYIANLYWTGKEDGKGHRNGKFMLNNGKLVLDKRAVKENLQVDDYDKE